MFEQDYIMRMFLQLATAIRNSMLKAENERDPKAAAGLIETAIGQATDMDGQVLLSLAPESIAGVMQVSGTDPQVAEYIARSLLLEAEYLRQADDLATADIREQQGYALAKEFGFELSIEMITEEEWDQFFSRGEDQELT